MAVLRLILLWFQIFSEPLTISIRLTDLSFFVPALEKKTKSSSRLVPVVQSEPPKLPLSCKVFSTTIITFFYITQHDLILFQFSEKDVAGIDINMGCPKHFSISGGMGAALLSNLPNACSIVRSIKQEVQIPVTCKIRVLEDTSETLNFCKAMEESGVSAITVHGRTLKERPQHSNRDSVIREIAANLSIPVIAKYEKYLFTELLFMKTTIVLKNVFLLDSDLETWKTHVILTHSILSIFVLINCFSSILTVDFSSGGSNNIDRYEDILKFKEVTKCSSIMVARAAQFNASIFRKNKLPLDDVIKAYLRYAIKYDNLFPNTKYCVQSMLRDLQETPRGKLFLETQNLLQIW